MALIAGILDFINKTKLLCIFSLCVLLLTGCGKAAPVPAPSDDGIGSKPPLSNSSDASETSDLNKYYKIYRGETEETRFFFYYDLYDSAGSLIESQCTYMSEPNISEISPDTLKISAQAGTGQSTRWSYYYNVVSNRLSSTFYYVLTEKEQTVAYFDGKQVIVCDAFDPDRYYKNIQLSNIMPNSIDPVVTAKFSDDLSELTVVYYSDSGEETSVTISVNQ